MYNPLRHARSRGSLRTSTEMKAACRTPPRTTEAHSSHGRMSKHRQLVSHDSKLRMHLH